MQKTIIPDMHAPEWSALKPIAWSSVSAGAITAITIGILLNMLGIGVGLAAFNINDSGILTYAIAGILWLTISTFIAMTVGGLIAGMLVRTHCQSFGGGLHGLLVWSLSLLLAFLLIGSVTIPAISGVTKSPAVTTSPVPHLAKEVTHPTNSSLMPSDQNTHNISTEEARRAAHYTGSLALLSFSVLLVGLIGATIGGKIGASQKIKE